MSTRALLLALLPFFAACRSSGAAAPATDLEAYSVGGRELLRPPLAPELLAEREEALAQARAARDADPADPLLQVMVGRRLSNLGRYREALATFEAGAARFPDDARFARYAGHRMITLRRFADAERELERAETLMAGREDEIEISVTGGKDIDWLAQSIQYHLGLARWFQGDWRGASDAFGACLAVSRNDDARCSAAYWLVLALRRQGREDAARAVLSELSGELAVVEYFGYRDLILYFNGAIDEAALLAPGRQTGGVEFATRAYGAAQWHAHEGRREAANALLEEIVAGGMWPAFGAIGAEIELGR